MTWNWDIFFLGKVWHGVPVGVQSFGEKGQASWLPASWDILIEFLDYILWLPKSEFAALMLPYKSNVFGGTGIEGLQLLVVNQWKEIFTVF